MLEANCQHLSENSSKFCFEIVGSSYCVELTWQTFSAYLKQMQEIGEEEGCTAFATFKQVVASLQ